MRLSRLRFIGFAIGLATVVSVACSKDSSSSDGGTTGPTTPGTNNNGINVAVDAAFAQRTAVAGSVLPAEVHVTQNGQPAPGVTITWGLSTGGGSVDPASSVSDANGVAATTWTLNDTARVSTLTAAVSGVTSATMQVTATAGPATSLVKVSADSIGVVAGASTLVTVRVTDKTGNPVSGVVVTWTSSGGALTVTSTTTGSSGNGQVVFSTGATPESYTVTATVAGLGALTFKVVGL